MTCHHEPLNLPSDLPPQLSPVRSHFILHLICRLANDFGSRRFWSFGDLVTSTASWKERLHPHSYCLASSPIQSIAYSIELPLLYIWGSLEQPGLAAPVERALSVPTSYLDLEGGSTAYRALCVLAFANWSGLQAFAIELEGYTCGTLLESGHQGHGECITPQGGCLWCA